MYLCYDELNQNVYCEIVPEQIYYEKSQYDSTYVWPVLQNLQTVLFFINSCSATTTKK